MLTPHLPHTWRTLGTHLSPPPQVFGGFTSTPWAPHPQYFGTGETFLFSFQRYKNKNNKSGDGGGGAQGAADETLKFYTWTAVNNFVMMATEEYIAMGGGGGDFGALTLSSCLLIDKSRPSSLNMKNF